MGPERLATLDMAHPGDAFRGLEEEGVRLKWAFGRTGTGSADRIPAIQTNRGNGCVRILLNERPLPIGARHAIDENPGSTGR